EDSAPLVEVLSELIADPGRIEIVGTADSVALAVVAIGAARADVVIVDLQLRDGNGFEVVMAIRALPANEDTVVILFTNHLSRALEKRAHEVGANFFFDKSRDHAKIIELIQEKARQRFGRGPRRRGRRSRSSLLRGRFVPTHSCAVNPATPLSTRSK
ncbi:MAG: response regulator, partial [Betaproteobacteria bacterium]